MELLYSYVLDRKRLTREEFLTRWHSPVLVYAPGKADESGLRRPATQTGMTPQPSWSEIKDVVTADAHRFRIVRLVLDLGVKQRTYRVGRERGVEVMINSRSVSKVHAEIALDGKGQLTVRDCGSKNGTVLDGKPVTDKAVRLAPPALVVFGDVEVRLLGPEDTYQYLGEFLVGDAAKK